MPSPKPLISIITPSFNARKFIDACLASIRQQDFDAYEHIIVDGGSTDGTIALLNEYGTGRQNVRVIVEKDEGIYDAMNKGIRAAAGEWLYFLGADDSLFDGGVLRSMARCISGTDARLIYGNVYFERFQRTYDGKFDTDKILTRNISHQAVFYHASVFQTLGLYDLRYRTQADYDLNIHCWLSGRFRIEFLPLTIARFADGGASSIQPDEQFRQDFPSRALDYLFASPRSLPAQVAILSAIFRKLLQRYPLRPALRLIFNGDHRIARLAGLAWMLLSSPYYLIRKLFP